MPPEPQLGFTPRRSCSTFAGYQWVSDGYSVDVLYFDLQKAFDWVPHNRLISKLQEGCGWYTSGHVLEWISKKFFLKGGSK